MRAGRLQRRVGALAGEPVLGGTFRVSRESGGSWPAVPVLSPRQRGPAGLAAPLRRLALLARVPWVQRHVHLCVLLLGAVQILRFFCNLGVT